VLLSTVVANQCQPSMATLLCSALFVLAVKTVFATSAPYWRLRWVENNVNGWENYIYSMQFYNALDTPISGTFSTNRGNTDTANIADGDDNTYIRFPPSGFPVIGDYVQFVCSPTCDVRKLTFLQYHGYPNWVLQLSLDYSLNSGASWVSEWPAFSTGAVTVTYSTVPTAMPTAAPSKIPTARPSAKPTFTPTAVPGARPTAKPTSSPTAVPTLAPTARPTFAPTRSPTHNPTLAPTAAPTITPTATPSAGPSLIPSTAPTVNPTPSPSSEPSFAPSGAPTLIPTADPSTEPTRAPTAPTAAPTNVRCQAGWQVYNDACYLFDTTERTWSSCQSLCGSKGANMLCINSLAENTFVVDGAPLTSDMLWIGLTDSANEGTFTWESGCTSSYRLWASGQPDDGGFFGNQDCVGIHTTDGLWDDVGCGTNRACACVMKYTVEPSANPTAAPTAHPTNIEDFHSPAPTCEPTTAPTTAPSASPTCVPSELPSAVPSTIPTVKPSSQPTFVPTAEPSAGPTVWPTLVPSAVPTISPTSGPTFAPTLPPTSDPTVTPTAAPTIVPTLSPSARPSTSPSAGPSSNPSAQPTSCPTGEPTAQPSTQPSASPSSQPSSQPTIDTALLQSYRSSPSYQVRNAYAFAVLTAGGAVLTWGEGTKGGNSSAVSHLLTGNITALVGSKFSYAALSADGSVVVWGDAATVSASQPWSGSPAVSITANEAAFAGLTTEAAVVAAGSAVHGGRLPCWPQCSAAGGHSLSHIVTAVTATAGPSLH
jgi:hypothetical protein